MNISIYLRTSLLAIFSFVFYMETVAFAGNTYSASVGSNVYMKVTSADEIVADGVYVIVNEQYGKVMSAKLNTSKMASSIDAQIVGGICSITVDNSDADPYEITFKKTSDYYLLKTNVGNVGCSSDGDKFDVNKSSTAERFQWDITELTNDSISIKNVSSGEFIRYRDNSDDFRTYLPPPGEFSIQLYKKVTDSTMQPLPLSFNPSSGEVNVGETLSTVLETPDDYNGLITYSSADEDIAVVNAEGVITGVGVGTVDITASASATDVYFGNNITFTVTVKGNVADDDIIEPVVYKRIKSTDELESGKRYLILASNSTKALSQHNGSDGFKVVGVTVNNEQYTGSVNEAGCPYELLVGDGKESGIWTIQYVANGQFIKAESSSSVGLKISDNATGNCNWSIEILETGNARIVNTKSTGRTLSVGTDYFKNYSGTAPVQLYKKITDAVNIPIGVTGYGTLYYGDVSLIVPEGVTAQTYSYSGEELVATHTYNAGDVIPKGTAVVLKGNAGTNYCFDKVASTAVAPSDNMLKGSDEDVQLEENNDVYYYKLSRNSSGDTSSVGFYWGAADGGPFRSPAHKAYLEIQRTSVTYGKSTFALGGTDGVESLRMDKEMPEDVVYSISGVRIKSAFLPKGVYIINGKKRIVR